MAAIYHAEIPVDLAGASRERPLPVQFFRGDNDSHIFTAWVGDSANPEAGLLAGTVAGTALRGDGVTVPLAGEKGSATVPVTFNGITVQATPCRVTLPQAAFRIPGMIKVSILLTDGGITTTVLSLSGSVVQTNTDAVTDPEELIPNLSALQTAAAQAIAAAEDAETAAESVPALVAPTFNTTTAYAAGDYVYYNGSIWRFTIAHAAGAWTGSDAVQTTVTDEYSDLKSAITSSATDRGLHLVYEILDRQEIKPEFLSGYWAISNGNWNSTATTYNGTEKIPVIGGSVLSTNVTGERYWLFWQEDGTFISSITGTNLTSVTAPDNSAYFALDALVGNIDENSAISFYSEIAENASNANTIITSALQYYQGINLYDGTYNPGYYSNTSVSGTTGDLVRSKPIWLEAGTYLFPSTAGQFGSTNGNAVFYVDSEGTCSQRVAGTSVGTATEDGKYNNRTINKFTLSDARYVAFNVGYKTAQSTATIEQLNNFMVVSGSVIADWPKYTPYVAPYYSLKPTAQLTETMRGEVNGTSGLIGKTAIFDGDSICAGKTVGQTDPSYGYGWAGRIGIANKMQYKNFGVNGGVIVSADNASATGRHSVVDNIDTMYSQYPNADFIIIEGGTNDADLQITLGTYTDGDFSGSYDDETFSGALETIFYKLTNYWKGKHIGYIVAQKMGTGSSLANRNVYFERARDICKKWGVPYCDLWNNCYLDPRNPNCYNSSLSNAENIEQGYLYVDGQHLTAKGYDYITPIIENWMKST